MKINLFHLSLALVAMTYLEGISRKISLILTQMQKNDFKGRGAVHTWCLGTSHWVPAQNGLVLAL